MALTMMEEARLQARICQSMYATMIFLFSVLGLGIATAMRGNSTVCIAALRWPTLFVSLSCIVVYFTSCCAGRVRRRNNDRPKAIYLFLVGLFFILVGLIVLFIFNYYALLSGKYWGPVTACLQHRNTCDGMYPMTGKKWTSSDGNLTISPVQSGCCKPPPSCGFTYVNGTTWSPPTPGAAAGGAPAPVSNDDDDDDCSRWSNDERTLCFQCDSCKASVLGGIEGVWFSETCVSLAVGLVLFSGCGYPILVSYVKKCDRHGMWR